MLPATAFSGKPFLKSVQCRIFAPAAAGHSLDYGFLN
jgi:hypothetical protein